jgi:hypothetical protein
MNKSSKKVKKKKKREGQMEKLVKVKYALFM